MTKQKLRYVVPVTKFRDVYAEECIMSPNWGDSGNPGGGDNYDPNDGETF